MVHRREEPEDEEEAAAFTLTEEEQEEGPEALAPLEGDAEVGGGPAWSPLFSSSSEHVKGQVRRWRRRLRQWWSRLWRWPAGYSWHAAG